MTKDLVVLFGSAENVVGLLKRFTDPELEKPPLSFTDSKFNICLASTTLKLTVFVKSGELQDVG